MLIEWVDYDSYSVVSVKQILRHSSEDQELQRGDVVDVREGTGKHKATIIASGIVKGYNIDSLVLVVLDNTSCRYQCK